MYHCGHPKRFALISHFRIRCPKLINPNQESKILLVTPRISPKSWINSMAYRRSIAARARFFYQQQHRISPSISNIHRGDSNESEELQTKSISRYPGVQNYIQQRFSVTGNNFSNYRRQKSVLQDRRFTFPAGCGMAYGRNYSSAGVEEGAADKIEVLDNVVGVLRDTAVEVAPAVNEVAVAAADSFAPVAALQYMIDYVHCFTGFNWWASIVVTTLIIRCLQLPLSIYHHKSSSKFALLKPHLVAVMEEVQNKGMKPKVVEEGLKKMRALFSEYGVTPFYPLKGPLITAPIFCCFFFAVSNMAEKVPSFKDGGILWFTDLSTPDGLYVFPVLLALTILIMVECNAAQEGMEGHPPSRMIKNVSRAFTALTVPLGACFPKALFCYWMTSGLFSLAYGLVIQKPEVKKYLGIPIVPVKPPPPQMSLEEGTKKIAESAKKFADSYAQLKKYALPSAQGSSKPMNQIIASSIKSSEKKVEGGKKGKKW